MAKAGGSKATKKLEEMSPFFREQLVARRIYSELMALDKPARRRVLGIVNDYAMSAAQVKPAHMQFKLEDEEEK